MYLYGCMCMSVYIYIHASGNCGEAAHKVFVLKWVDWNMTYKDRYDTLDKVASICNFNNNNNDNKNKDNDIKCKHFDSNEPPRKHIWMW